MRYIYIISLYKAKAISKSIFSIPSFLDTELKCSCKLSFVFLITSCIKYFSATEKLR